MTGTSAGHSTYSGHGCRPAGRCWRSARGISCSPGARARRRTPCTFCRPSGSYPRRGRLWACGEPLCILDALSAGPRSHTASTEPRSERGLGSLVGQLEWGGPWRPPEVGLARSDPTAARGSRPCIQHWRPSRWGSGQRWRVSMEVPTSFLEPDVPSPTPRISTPAAAPFRLSVAALARSCPCRRPPSRDSLV